MSIPAGWYDDGSGRTRWWDGAQWTDHFAPDPDALASNPAAAVGQDAPTEQYAATQPYTPTEQYPPTQQFGGAQQYGNAQQSAPTQAYGAYAPPAAPGAQYPGAAYPAAPGPQKPPVIGFIALGLGILGTILACIPPVVWIFGFLLLFAAFVLGLIGLFIKDTRKWPAITGLILSIVGAIIGATVGTIILFATLATNLPDTALNPTESTTQAPETDSGDRPTTEEVASGLRAVLVFIDPDSEDLSEDQITCIAQYFVDSDLSDEHLRILSQGPDAFLEDAGAIEQIIPELGQAMIACAL